MITTNNKRYVILPLKRWKLVDPSDYKDREWLVRNDRWLDSINRPIMFRDLVDHYILGKKSVWFSIHNMYEEHITPQIAEERICNILGYTIKSLLKPPEILLPDFYGEHPFLARQDENGVYKKYTHPTFAFIDTESELEAADVLAKFEHWKVPSNACLWNWNKYHKYTTLTWYSEKLKFEVVDRNKMTYTGISKGRDNAIAKAMIRCAVTHNYPAKLRKMRGEA